MGPDPDFVSQCLDYGSDCERDAMGAPSAGAEISNPMLLPPGNQEYLWLQLVDTIDDYFDIESEQRPVNLGGTMSEGRIETHYVPGATFLEPWRWDSASVYDRALATFQSIRRRASVQVMPQPQGVAVGVIVETELEDVSRPVQEMPGSTVPRHDGSLIRLNTNVDEDKRNLGWIPIGRDFELEEEILYQLRRRLEGGAR
ncbi:MAG: hypothetical protein AAGF97_17230 [Planctomycetota bacterium]